MLESKLIGYYCLYDLMHLLLRNKNDDSFYFVTLFGHNVERSLECLSWMWTRSFFVTGDRFTFKTLNSVPSSTTFTRSMIDFEIGSSLADQKTWKLIITQLPSIISNKYNSTISLIVLFRPA